MLRELREPEVRRTGAVPEVQAGELPELREQVLQVPSWVYRNRRRRLNLRDFLYHKWDKTYITLPFCGSLRAPG